MDNIRSPIVSVLGHVDHGKSTLLDTIRGSNIIKKEAGGITQAIGASIVPTETIMNVCGKLLDPDKAKQLAGLLFIDTPGHAAFTTMRKRGGNLADIAVLVVDINDGLMPQTIEAIEILKQYKTPFLIAANKIDRIQGFTADQPGLLKILGSQGPNVTKEIETKLYELVGKLHEKGFAADRFDRVSDFGTQLAIVPISALKGIGLPELLMVLVGLSQKYLEEHLEYDVNKPAKGTILEVKEEKGLGTTLDVILFDGTLKVNDTIVIGGMDEPIVTKVRALLEPKPLSEMRDTSSKFVSVKQVVAATGVKIAAPDLDKAIAGMPIVSTTDIEQACEQVQEEIEDITIETDGEGVIVKADNIGSLEAIIKLLREDEIPIRKASVGQVSKKDIVEAKSNIEKDPKFAAVLAFNTAAAEELSSGTKVKVIESKIIYQLLDELKAWFKDCENAQTSSGSVAKPCSSTFVLMPGILVHRMLFWPTSVLNALRIV